ncbi:MAG TPA: hypothetical protein VFH56_12925 [Acidimicrobiales bacterium]|nr:hypothetical protein [Acidimicrobiales bacterium]
MTAAARRSFRQQQTGVAHGAAPGSPPSGSAWRRWDVTGPGKVGKLAEICAAVVLAGEISLGGAVIHGDWVASHERLGANG